jgi:hypothetical protein
LRCGPTRKRHDGIAGAVEPPGAPVRRVASPTGGSDEAEDLDRDVLGAQAGLAGEA